VKCSICQTRGATGNPAICGICYEEQLFVEAEDSTVNQLLDHPAVQGLMDKGFQVFNKGVDRIIGRVDGYAKLAMQMVQNQQTQQAQAPQPVQQSPREVLHFGPDEALTIEKIKTRKRDLASLCHPDKNGSVEAMQKINEAADLLLKEVN